MVSTRTAARRIAATIRERGRSGFRFYFDDQGDKLTERYGPTDFGPPRHAYHVCYSSGMQGVFQCPKPGQVQRHLDALAEARHVTTDIHYADWLADSLLEIRKTHPDTTIQEALELDQRVAAQLQAEEDAELERLRAEQDRDIARWQAQHTTAGQEA